jgi:putative SOS response-associated peptidase YedK
MCFHTQQTKPLKIVAERFNVKYDANNNPVENARFNGFNHPKCPVIASDKLDLLQFFEWGLLPPWAKNKDFQKNTLNAKVETLCQKPSFKHVVNQRCLVVVDGFFEWQWNDSKGKIKQPYLITYPQNQLFALAGLWNKWENLDNGELLSTFTIITTQANPLMQVIHNHKQRMPLVLEQQQEANWLSGTDITAFLPCNPHLLAHKLGESQPQIQLF